MKNNEGNAEIMGVVLLISIFVAAVALMGVTMLSSPQPEKVPAVAFDFWTNDNNTSISLIHRGGDTLNLSGAQLKIIYSDGTSTENPAVSIDWGQPQSWLGISTSYLFHIGDSITFNATKSINQVQLIWPGTGVASMTGGGGAVLLGAWSPNSSSGRLVPAAVTDAVPISSQNPEQTIPTMTPDPGWDLPDIFFFGNPIVVPSRSDVQFNVTTLYGPHNATSYNWSFGYGNNQTNVTPEKANVTHTYNTTSGSDYNVYNVTLTGSLSDGRSRSFTRDSYITVYNPPVATFIANVTSGLAPLTVGFTDKSTGYVTGWNWDFGDSTSSPEKNPTHTYTAAGTYNVTLTVSDPYASSKSLPIQITVLPPPTTVLTTAPTTTVPTPTPSGGMINGTIYNHPTSDTVKNTNDPKLAGWTLNLMLDNKDKPVIATTTSDASGAYAFYGLGKEKYKVGVVLPVGWQGTNPASGVSPQIHINGANDQFPDINFWNYYKPVSTGGTIFLSTAKPGYIVSGSSMQFQVTNPGWSGNKVFSFEDGYSTHVNAGDIMKIVIWTSGNGVIQPGGWAFQTINIADASLYIQNSNGDFTLMHRGHLTGIALPGFNNFQSTITLTIPSQSANVDFRINNKQVSEIPLLYVPDSKIINLYNISVDSNGGMNINYAVTPSGPITIWSGTVSGYQVLP